MRWSPIQVLRAGLAMPNSVNNLIEFNMNNKKKSLTPELSVDLSNCEVVTNPSA